MYLEEVFNCFFLIHSLIVWTVNFYLSNVGFNYLWIITQRLDEKKFVAHFSNDNFVDQLAALKRSICGIEYLGKEKAINM